MENLNLLIKTDITYIIDQLISTYINDKRIITHTKELCLVPPDKGSDVFNGAYAYSIDFEDIKDVLSFGFDFGRCMVAAESLDEMKIKKGG